MAEAWDEQAGLAVDARHTDRIVHRRHRRWLARRPRRIDSVSRVSRRSLAIGEVAIHPNSAGNMINACRSSPRPRNVLDEVLLGAWALRFVAMDRIGEDVVRLTYVPA